MSGPSRRPPSRVLDFFRAHEWFARLGLFAMSLAVVLAIGEVAARIARSGQPGGKEGREDAQYKEYDPLLGWRKKSGSRATYRRREYTVEVQMNSRGLRDPERSVEPGAGTFRVLALGDSFVEGYTVASEQTVTQRLQNRLTAAGCPSDVINGGTSAYSTDQESLFYSSDGARYRASLVLLFFFWNDVIYSDRQDYFGTPKPVFEMGGGQLRLHRYPVKQKEQTGAPAPIDDDDGEQPWSVLLDLLRERLWVGAPRAHDALARLGLWNPIPKITPRQEMLVYDRRDLAPIEDAWEKVEAILKDLRRNVSDHGAKLAIVYVPGQMEVSDASWRATTELYRLADDAWRRDKVATKIKAIGSGLDIPVLDLNPALREATGLMRPTYFNFDIHWTARGHDVASQAVFDWMKSSGNLPQSCGGGLPLLAASGSTNSPPTPDASPVP